MLLAESRRPLVGYVDRWREAERDRAWLDVRALDGEADAGARLSRSRAAGAAGRRSGRAGDDVRAGVDARFEPSSRQLGFDRIRHSYRMAIDLDAEPAEPIGRTGSRSAPLAADEAAVYEAIRSVPRTTGSTSDETFEEWRHWLLGRTSFDPRLWFLARAGDELAGFSVCATDTNDPTHGHVGCSVSGGRGGGRDSAWRCCCTRSRISAARADAWHLGVDASSPTGATAPLRAGRDARLPALRLLASRSSVSRLRARCPDCRTLTAVALGPEYQCHSCGREFAAGLVRVPRAWGTGGEGMAEAAFHELPYPEAAVIEADTLAEQTLLLASELPDRPVVLGGCCCSHVGAIEALSSGEERLAVVWIDAHGDLNTPETSPSGNAWGMPLRMVLDDGAVLRAARGAVGARNLDPPEVEFIEASGIQTGEGRDRAGARGCGRGVRRPGRRLGRAGRARRLHARAGRAAPDGDREAPRRRRCAQANRRSRLHRTCCDDAANEPKLARLATALGL